MIVNLPTISNKRLVSNPDGSRIVELGESVFQYKKQAVVTDVITITQEQAGKPWQIAMIYYSTESAMSALFFMNGYPNPYAVNEGDKLLIFDQESINNCIIDMNSNTREFYNHKPTELPNKISKVAKVDANRQAILSKLNITTPVALAPNQSNNVPSFSAADGIITLGTDVSDARCKSDNLSDTQTRTERIRAAIKKKLGVTK